MPVLEFIPATRKVLRLLAAEPAEFASTYGVRLHEVAQATAQAGLEFMKTFNFETPAKWFGYFAVEGETQQLAGVCSFKGPAILGAVEIVCYTFPGLENRGIGTAMARFLVERAHELPGVRRVVAHTPPGAEGPARVAEKAGLRRAGETEEDGQSLWVWELALGGDME